MKKSTKKVDKDKKRKMTSRWQLHRHKGGIKQKQTEFLFLKDETQIVDVTEFNFIFLLALGAGGLTNGQVSDLFYSTRL